MVFLNRFILSSMIEANATNAACKLAPFRQMGRADHSIFSAIERGVNLSNMD